VRLITKSLDWLTAVASEVKKSTALLDHLDQANLAKAFRGELVPQDTADEPASVLLERIRAEHENRSQPKRGRGKEDSRAAA
jgi:type I restriction enzyme, S subunit